MILRSARRGAGHSDEPMESVVSCNGTHAALVSSSWRQGDRIGGSCRCVNCIYRGMELQSDIYFVREYKLVRGHKTSKIAGFTNSQVPRGFPRGTCQSRIRSGLSLQVRKFLQQGIGNGDDTAVGLETTLGGDHRGELTGEIHVTHFQNTGVHLAA